MDNENKSILTDNQKKIIKKLDHPIYDIEYIEEWIGRVDDIETNAPAALIEMGVEVFMDVVKVIEKAYPETQDKISLKVTKYAPGLNLEEGFGCTITNCGRFDVDLKCENCDWHTHTPYITNAYGRRTYLDKNSNVVIANGKKYVMNDALADMIVANIESTLKIAGMDISNGDENDEQPWA